MTAPHDSAPSLRLPQVLTQKQARSVLVQLQPLVQGARDTRVPVDASAVAQFDSSALAVLLALRRTALGAGRQLEVQHLPAGLAAMARLYGVMDLLQPH